MSLQPLIKVIESKYDCHLVGDAIDHKSFYGFPIGGVMVRSALKLGNQLLKKPENSNAIECTFKAATFEFIESQYIILVGAEMDWKLNGNGIILGKPKLVKKGDKLTGSYAKQGLRSYLLTSSELVLQKNHSKLKSGDIISGKRLKRNPKAFNKERTLDHVKDQSIYFKRGPEWNLLSQADKEIMINGDFSLTENMSRMGAYINGPELESFQALKASVCTFPGLIQLLPNGQLLILLQDAQITGGYPRITYLMNKSLDRFNQLRPGDKIKWELTLD